MKVKDIFSGFSVKSLDEARHFYAKTLGFAVTKDDMGLHITLPHGDTVFVYEKPNHVPASFTILNLVVDSIDVAVQELTAKGVQFIRYDDLPAPQDKLGVLRGKAAGMGPDIAWCMDPSGNIVAVLEP